jgi:NAD(P)-dependent dehydrogenase (short-subunit alcohol dehydrogenase family)
VNNAALNYYIPTADYPTNRWIKAFAVNVHAPFMLAKAVLPDMMAAGRGCHRQYRLGRSHRPGRGPYADQTVRGGVMYGASKAALERFTQGWAQEVAKQGGISVSCVSPSAGRADAGHGLSQAGRRPRRSARRAALMMARAACCWPASLPRRSTAGSPTASRSCKEFGWIDKGVGRGIDTVGSGYSQI